MLNKQQISVIQAPPGKILCVAGAGTGKTTTVIAKIAHEVESGHILPQEILALTFTKKAAGEMRSRLRERIGSARAKEVWIGTIHSYCLKEIIKPAPEWFGFTPGLKFRFEDDYFEILKAMRLNKEKKELQLLAKRFSTHVTKGIPISGPHEPLFYKMRSYQHRYNILTFDDIIHFGYRRLEDDAQFRQTLASRFKLVICDESQDNALTQHRIILNSGSVHQNIIFVGDDDQSIYGWRSAEPRHFIGLREQGFSSYFLEFNYRSTPEILALGNAVLKHNQGARIEKTLKPHQINPNAQRTKPKFAIFQEFGFRKKSLAQAQAITEQRWIAEKVHAYLRKPETSPEEVAVLCRSVNNFGRLLQPELRRLGVPYRVVGGADIAKNPHVQKMIALLSLSTGSHYQADWETVLSTLPGIGQTRAERLSRLMLYKETDNEPALAGQNRVLESLRGDQRLNVSELFLLLGRIRASQNNVDQCLELFEEWYLPWVAPEEGADDEERLGFERTKKNLGAVRGALMSAAEENQGQEGEGGKLGVALENFQFSPPEHGEVIGGKDLDAPAVTISTIHRAKGLEWPLVFVPDLSDEVLPSTRCHGDRQQLEEECRVLHVAVTRAKRELFLSATVPTLNTVSRFLVGPEFDSLLEYIRY